jgi:hypothetical protein
MKRHGTAPIRRCWHDWNIQNRHRIARSLHMALLRSYVRRVTNECLGCQVIVYTRAYGSMQARMCSPAIGETDCMVRTYPSPIMDSSTFPASGKLAVSEAKRNQNSMLLMTLSTELCCAALVLNRLPFYHWRHPWLLEASTFVAVRVCLRVTCFFSQEHRGYP